MTSGELIIGGAFENVTQFYCPAPNELLDPLLLLLLCLFCYFILHILLQLVT